MHGAQQGENLALGVSLQAFAQELLGLMAGRFAGIAPFSHHGPFRHQGPRTGLPTQIGHLNRGFRWDLRNGGEGIKPCGPSLEPGRAAEFQGVGIKAETGPLGP